MKKYELKDGTPIKVGDKATVQLIFKDQIITKGDIELTPIDINEGIKEGTIVEDSSIMFYIKRIRKEYPELSSDFFYYLKTINKMEFFRLILKEISDYLNENTCSDNITFTMKSDYAYVIDSISGKITMVHTEDLDLSNIAFFFTYDDAKFACQVLNKYMKDLFGINVK